MTLNQFVESVIYTLDIRQGTTAKTYLGAYRRNIAPYLGDKNLEEITKNDLVTALAPLPSQSRYQAVMIARTVFREAVERQLIQESPAATIKTPKIQVKPQKFLTWEELSQLDFGYQTKRIKFLALHGLRYGEAAALTKDDIHDGFVHITKSKYGATKSSSGVRKVPLLGEFMPFPKYQKCLATALKPHGVTVHSLRKTYAYTLKSAGIHVTTAAQLMGHSNPMVTLKIYTQVKDDETGKAGIELAKYLAS